LSVVEVVKVGGDRYGEGMRGNTEKRKCKRRRGTDKKDMGKEVGEVEDVEGD
jgi:hypothetical protein